MREIDKIIEVVCDTCEASVTDVLKPRANTSIRINLHLKYICYFCYLAYIDKKTDMTLNEIGNKLGCSPRNIHNAYNGVVWVLKERRTGYYEVIALRALLDKN